MKTPSYKTFRWIPRILCLLAILFISMFALDSFDPKLTFWQQILGFIMHLIPSFILAIILFIAWKRELIGGWILVAIGILFSFFLFPKNLSINHSFWMTLGIVALLTGPFILAGYLFIVSHNKKNKQTADLFFPSDKPA